MLMRSVFPSIGLGLDQRAIVFDAASDIMSVLAGMGLRCPVVTLNPFDARCHAWSMHRDIRTRVDCQTFAANIVHIDEHASQKFFDQSVRSLFQETLWALIKTGKPWNFRDVLVILRNEGRLRRVLSTTAAGRDVVELCFGNPETGLNVMATVNVVTDPFLAVAACWHRAELAGRAVSLSDWLQQESILVLGNSHKARPAVQALNRVVFTQVSQLILDQPEDLNRRNWIFLDEVRQAGRLSALTDFMVEGRKRGACLCLGFQDIEGMIHVHTPHLARELCGQAHNIAITRLVNPETADLVSKMFGEYESDEEEVSYSYDPFFRRTKSVRRVIAKRQGVLPSELMSLPMPSPERGLSFYALLPHFSGGFRHTMPGVEVDAMLPHPNKDPRRGGMADIEPRDGSHQELSPFSEADFARFGIEPPDESVDPGAALKPRRRRRQPGKLPSLRNPGDRIQGDEVETSEADPFFPDSRDEGSPGQESPREKPKLAF
jgi:type IV secretory pathway TraG/TraD family ATPase VirD4